MRSAGPRAVAGLKKLVDCQHRLKQVVLLLRKARNRGANHQLVVFSLLHLKAVQDDL